MIKFLTLALVFTTALASGQNPVPPVPADVASAPVDAIRTESGLAYKVVQAGSGAQHPTRADRVLVHYTGWTASGRMFDSSVKRGSPSSLRLSDVIPGWTEGVALMVEGERTRFWVPQELAYKGKRKPYGALVFDIELIKIN